MALRAALVLGLGLAAVLYVDYRQADMALCAPNHGCDIVRRSAYVYYYGLSTPGWGALALSICDARFWRRLLVLVTIAGALVGAALVAIQAFVLKAVCPYCLVVDLIAVALPFLAIASLHAAKPTGVWPRLAYLALAAGIVTVAIMVPSNSSDKRPPPVDFSKRPEGIPDFVKREQRAGIATVIVFTDFECPYCREFETQLDRMRIRFGDRLRIVRKHWPVKRHENARPAAIAAICAEELGEGERAANELFRAPAEKLGMPKVRDLIISLGVDPAAFDGCLNSDRPEKRLDQDHKEGESVPLMGVPSMFVGSVYFVGAPENAILRKTIEGEILARK
jgi:predicted DsbA family dithiol-disulfide isomerase/uncharacterized membrane protein